MFILKLLKNILVVRGFFASFLVISGWLYATIIFIVLIYNFFLCIIGKKYYDYEFRKKIIKEAKECKNHYKIALYYNLNPRIVARWIKRDK